MSKRIFDLLFSVVGLLVLSPLLFVVVCVIKFSSAGPALFRQRRVGLNGKCFEIYKFRTMVVDAEKKGLKVTVGNDSRITYEGRVLRKLKIDELPQLWNVLKGDMSFVGPRPEVEKYMSFYDPDVRARVLSVRPGITDRASIEFRDENTILSMASDPERAYVEDVLPVKQRFYLEYVAKHSMLTDVKIIIDTLRLAVFRF